MKINNKNIVKNTKKILHNFPVFFAIHVWTVFTIVAFLVLSYGFIIFYQDAYSLPQQEYETFLRARKVNVGNLKASLELVEEKNINTPSNNPFSL